MKARARTVSLVVVVLGVAFIGTARAEAPWCSGVGNNSIDAHGDLKDLQERDDPRWTIPALVAATCKPDAEQKAQQREIAAARDKWSQKLDMSDADWADAVAYATQDRYAAGGSLRLDTSGAKRAWSSLDAVDQFLILSGDEAASGDITHDKNYLADALGNKLTELGRAGYVQRCVDGSGDNVVQWAICAADVAQLDWKKTAGELRATRAYSGADKMKVRLALLGLKAKLVEHAAAVKKVTARDPGYAKVFAVAETARKEWDAGHVADAAFVELAAAMDDARALNSRRAFAGCADKTWSAWKRATATVPAKKFEGLRDDRENGKSFLDGAMAPLINSPNVYLASVAYTTCMAYGQEGGDRGDLLVRSLGDAMQRWPGFRGRRTYAHTTVLTSGIELDDRDAKLDYPDVDRSFGGGGGSHGGGGIGVVASLKPAGKTVTVTFKKQMVKQRQCAQEKYTHRITRILSDGTVLYEHICTRYEMVVVDKSDEPQTVSARYMEGVKPGVVLSNLEDVVLATWAKPGAALPSTIFGVALK